MKISFHTEAEIREQFPEAKLKNAAQEVGKGIALLMIVMYMYVLVFA